jgi:hypothetical protein
MMEGSTLEPAAGLVFGERRKLQSELIVCGEMSLRTREEQKPAAETSFQPENCGRMPIPVSGAELSCSAVVFPQ